MFATELYMAFLEGIFSTLGLRVSIVTSTQVLN